MDERAIQFLEVMIGLVVVGAAAFLVLLINNAVRPAGPTASAQRRAADGTVIAAETPPRWYTFFLAAILLVIVTVVMAWQVVPWNAALEAPDNWRSSARPQVFFWLMLVVAAVGVLIFLITVFVRWSRTFATPETYSATAPVATGESAAAAEPEAERASGVGRFIGLLLLAIAFLLLNWIYLEPAAEHALMLYGLYPASMALALVLLFDKATRRWHMKSPVESYREWLFCDGFVFLLVLGYVHLWTSQVAENYVAQFWDFLGLFVFFVIFWLVDRTGFRYRFLFAYIVLIGLPILLLIWRTVQEVPIPEDQSWWRTIWPFFFFAIIGFVLEIITLIATEKDSRSVIPAIKDTLFHALYGILLIISIPEAA